MMEYLNSQPDGFQDSFRHVANPIHQQLLHAPHNSVIAGPVSIAVHILPIRLSLGMEVRVPINLGGRSLEELGKSLRALHVDRTMNAYLFGLILPNWQSTGEEV